MRPSLRLSLPAQLFVALNLLALGSSAQVGSVERRLQARLEAGQQPASLPVSPARIARLDMLGLGARPAILLTGYWPPSNEMLRRFSDDPTQNPLGWIGSNWEGRGYDVYSYFPEFTPANCSSCGQGSGDLEVDYQDTSADFWPIANGLSPIAVITFSRGSNNLSWEVEMNQYNRASWVGDYSAPTQPTPVPPDASVPPGYLRLSKLPVQAIVDAIDAAALGLNPFICFSGDGGGFLSEFIAYHGVWYQSLHDDPTDPDWCVAAGHVHVGRQIDWLTARLAAEETLRTVMDHVDAAVDCNQIASFCTSAPNSVGAGALMTSTGPASISAASFALGAVAAPANSLGLFYYGSNQLQVPFGDGFRCVGGSEIFRLNPPDQADIFGTFARPLDFASPPLSSGNGQALPGQSWNFQLWYRDPAAAGSGFNLSDGLSVVWCP